ncbi:hypothetical protein BD309DRAFT_818750, partial [Dichomitus squalens]
MSPNNDLPSSSHPSLLDLPSMQSPTLPVEVIENVIDCCSDDTTTLLAFALTCRDLHPRSILVLFTDVYLRRREQLFDFCDALKANPKLRPVVHSVSILWEVFAPFPLLSFLPALRHIALNSFSHDIHRNMQLRQSTLLCCKRFGSGIRSLTIGSALFSTRTGFLQLLSAFPDLEDLTCEGVWIKQKHEATPLV